MPQVMGKKFSYSKKGKAEAKKYVDSMLSVGKTMGMYSGTAVEKMQNKYGKRTKVDKKK